MSCDEFNQHI